MRTAFVLAAALIARVASAQPAPAEPPAPAPAPGAPLPVPAPGPTPAPSPAPGPPGETPPATDVAPPKPDPAYGDRPDNSVIDATGSMTPGIRRGRDIVVRYTPDRSRENIVLMALIAGGGVLFGGVGLYYHFDSRSAADEVSAKVFTGRAWTQEREERYDTANRSASIAGVAYGIGGALLITTAIVFMVTEPKQVETVITPNTKPKPVALVAPTRGGAIVGTAWRF